jgi:hypothetical protein
MKLCIVVEGGHVTSIQSDDPKSLDILYIARDPKSKDKPEIVRLTAADNLTPENEAQLDRRIAEERAALADTERPPLLHISCDGDIETTDLDHCPFCGESAEDASYGSVDIEVGIAVQEGTCGHCGALWHDAYGEPVRILDLAGDPAKERGKDSPR